MYSLLVELPPEEQQLLRDLSPDLPALRARVRALRARGWTLQSIGEPLGARRSTVRSWELHPRPDPPNSPLLPSPPDPPTLPPRPPHTSSPTSFPPNSPSPRDSLRIQQLAPVARRARAGTPPSSRLFQARHELNQLVLSLYNSGVPVSTLAGLAGVTYRAMSVRIKTAAEEHATGGVTP